jgi:WD40 repeat protein
MPPDYSRYLEHSFADNSLRFFSSDKKLLGLFENTHQGQLTCTHFADSRTLLTAGVDCVLSAWTIVSGSKNVDLQPRTSLFGHKTPVTIINVSKSFSTILSVSMDGLVLLWDLNRLEFVRKLAKSGPVECARINDVTGTIMLCRGQKVVLYTLNGELILDQNVCVDVNDYVYSCAFYEGTGNEWLEEELVFTGHRRGLVNVWRKVVRGGRWVLELVKRLENEATEGVIADSQGAVTCILPMAQTVYTGDEDGKVVSSPIYPGVSDGIKAN